MSEYLESKAQDVETTKIEEEVVDQSKVPAPLEEQLPEDQKFNMALAMDSTAAIEFTIVDNTKYSEEIIRGACEAYDFEKLKVLKKSQDLTAFYSEGKNQILTLWHADQALAIHLDMFRVKFQIWIGEILNDIEPTFKKKSDYIKWLKENFEDKHIRYFQQAKQLDEMGDFAREYAAVGKNRLLALERMRKVEKKRECEALFEDYPLPDMTEDDDGHLLKRHIDSIITKHRLINAGIRFATFDQAALIASFKMEAITVKTAEAIKIWLDQQPEDQRQALVNRYIQDQMTYPSDHPYTPAQKASLKKILADLLNVYGTGNVNDNSWIESQREVLDMESLRSAQRFITQLIERITTDEPITDASTETTAASPAETQATV